MSPEDFYSKFPEIVGHRIFRVDGAGFKDRSAIIELQIRGWFCPAGPSARTDCL